jgi:hypothetical protein
VLFLPLFLSLPLGCADAGEREGAVAPQPIASLTALDGSRYVWVEADCNDGPLDLAKLGFERELQVQASPSALLLTFDTELITAGCTATSVWLARPAGQAELWSIEPQAVVTQPPEGDCGARERDATLGSVRAAGDLLELVLQRSAWCRGFDARFVYRRTEPAQLGELQLVARYVAHWNRSDAAALSSLFVDGGALIEPFTRTDDGNYKRHEGRAEVRAWYESAFASSAWHAMRLLQVTPGTTAGHVTADWEYMDARLAQPLVGRNLFVIAGGEIYETEIQLVSDPRAADTKPATVQPASAP